MSKLSEWQRSWECKLGLFKEKLDNFVVTMPISKSKSHFLFFRTGSAARSIKRETKIRLKILQKM